ncbi:carboxy terminal-processing peptidase [Pseudofulvimonas gallinarii]|uniref:Carboxyl-terminal processing protease n=1 Tax=Pseudofulvimonas gallinarii TaxID=634155 RepID=A0A4R3LHT3_9GAMM|nr:carboxy terminal-processing peptidase [Pseudofulvimonas gallinarii]TCS98004.1 carboxyl-terminal processing protease [Pseudofulvimonas gallinarii]THD13154.1 tail-specific protease [Pseudofulvimonas gallinarii]
MMRRFPLALVTALLVAGLVTAKPAAPPSQLSPLPDQGKTAAFTMYTLSRVHYRSMPLDDALSVKIYDAYLEAIDNDKLFLLRSDVDAFSVYREKLDDAIRNQQLDPPFELFNRYIQRVAERTAHARALLAQGFDFTVDEQYHYDRKEAQWAADTAELDEIWRKRVKNDWLRLKLAGKQDSEIAETLDKRYSRFLERIRELDSEDVFQTFLNAYAMAIEPHTSYLAPRTADAFEIQMSLSLEGIGAVLQRDDEYTVIRSLVPGGPAEKAGLGVGDRVLAVGQDSEGAMVDVIGWRIDDTVKLIRGPKDSTVRLDIVPAAASVDSRPNRISIVRQKVKLEEQAAKKRIIEVGEGDSLRRIGVIELPTFYQDFEGRRRGEADYRSATRDVANLLNQLKHENVDGVVLDLRNNGGGSLTEATELTGLFIDEGPVVQVKSAQGRVEIERDRRPGRTWDGPLAVLVNRVSASASEIFAAAIQDYGRGLIIGEPTYGKGTVQNLVSLDQLSGRGEARHGQLKFTVAQFFRINGSSTQIKGVVPDIQFPVSLDAEDYGESVYDNALPWAQIEPADYEQVANLDPLVPSLLARHESRIAEDQEFRFWQEDIADYRRQRERKSVSLLEDTRRQERDEQEARRKNREALRVELGLVDESNASRGRSDDGLQADERSVVEQAAEERARREGRPDALLSEAARILADAISLGTDDLRLAGLAPAKSTTSTSD